MQNVPFIISDFRELSFCDYTLEEGNRKVESEQSSKICILKVDDTCEIRIKAGNTKKFGSTILFKPAGTTIWSRSKAVLWTLHSAYGSLLRFQRIELTHLLVDSRALQRRVEQITTDCTGFTIISPEWQGK